MRNRRARRDLASVGLAVLAAAVLWAAASPPATWTVAPSSLGSGR